MRCQSALADSSNLGILVSRPVKNAEEFRTWLGDAVAFVRALSDLDDRQSQATDTHNSGPLCRIAERLHHHANEHAELSVADHCTLPGRPRQFSKAQVLANLRRCLECLPGQLAECAATSPAQARIDSMPVVIRPPEPLSEAEPEEAILERARQRAGQAHAEQERDAGESDEQWARWQAARRCRRALRQWLAVEYRIRWGETAAVEVPEAVEAALSNLAAALYEGARTAEGGRTLVDIDLQALTRAASLASGVSLCRWGDQFALAGRVLEAGQDCSSIRERLARHATHAGGGGVPEAACRLVVALLRQDWTDAGLEEDEVDRSPTVPVRHPGRTSNLDWIELDARRALDWLLEQFNGRRRHVWEVELAVLKLKALPAALEVLRIDGVLVKCESLPPGLGFNRLMPGDALPAEAGLWSINPEGLIQALRRQAGATSPTPVQADPSPTVPEGGEGGLPTAESATIPTAQAVTDPDGPFGMDGFRFRGVEVRFGRAAKQYSLVLALWDEESKSPAPPRSIADVAEAVWGHDADTADSTFRQLCVDTRTRFEIANCPLTVRHGNGKALLVIL